MNSTHDSVPDGNEQIRCLIPTLDETTRLVLSAQNNQNSYMKGIHTPDPAYHYSNAPKGRQEYILTQLQNALFPAYLQPKEKDIQHFVANLTVDELLSLHKDTVEGIEECSLYIKRFEHSNVDLSKEKCFRMLLMGKKQEFEMALKFKIGNSEDSRKRAQHVAISGNLNLSAVSSTSPTSLGNLPSVASRTTTLEFSPDQAKTPKQNSTRNNSSLKTENSAYSVPHPESVLQSNSPEKAISTTISEVLPLPAASVGPRTNTIVAKTKSVEAVASTHSTMQPSNKSFLTSDHLVKNPHQLPSKENVPHNQVIPSTSQIPANVPFSLKKAVLSPTANSIPVAEAHSIQKTNEPLSPEIFIVTTDSKAIPISRRVIVKKFSDTDIENNFASIREADVSYDKAIRFLRTLMSQLHLHTKAEAAKLLQDVFLLIDKSKYGTEWDLRWLILKEVQTYSFPEFLGSIKHSPRIMTRLNQWLGYDLKAKKMDNVQYCLRLIKMLKLPEFQLIATKLKEILDGIMAKVEDPETRSLTNDILKFGAEAKQKDAREKLLNLEKDAKMRETQSTKEVNELQQGNAKSDKNLGSSPSVYDVNRSKVNLVSNTSKNKRRTVSMEGDNQSSSFLSQKKRRSNSVGVSMKPLKGILKRTPMGESTTNKRVTFPADPKKLKSIIEFSSDVNGSKDIGQREKMDISEGLQFRKDKTFGEDYTDNSTEVNSRPHLFKEHYISPWIPPRCIDLRANENLEFAVSVTRGGNKNIFSTEGPALHQVKGHPDAISPAESRFLVTPTLSFPIRLPIDQDSEGSSHNESLNEEFEVATSWHDRNNFRDCSRSIPLEARLSNERMSTFPRKANDGNSSHSTLKYYKPSNNDHDCPRKNPDSYNTSEYTPKHGPQNSTKFKRTPAEPPSKFLDNQYRYQAKNPGVFYNQPQSEKIRQPPPSNRNSNTSPRPRFPARNCNNRYHEETVFGPQNHDYRSRARTDDQRYRRG